MTIHQRCPKCHAEFDLPDEVAGKIIRCYQCHQIQTIPEAATPSVVNDEAPIELEKPLSPRLHIFFGQQTYPYHHSGGLGDPGHRNGLLDNSEDPIG